MFCPLQWQHACSSLDFYISFDPFSSPNSATEKVELLDFILNTEKLSWFEQAPQEVKEPGLSQLGLQILYSFLLCQTDMKVLKIFSCLMASVLCFCFKCNILYWWNTVFFKGLKITCFTVTELFVFFVLDNSGQLLRVLNHSLLG